MGEIMSNKSSGANDEGHHKWQPNHEPYKEHPPATIKVPPEVQQAVNLGTGQHFEEMQAREKFQKNHQKPAQ